MLDAAVDIDASFLMAGSSTSITDVAKAIQTTIASLLDKDHAIQPVLWHVKHPMSTNRRKDEDEKEEERRDLVSALPQNNDRLGTWRPTLAEALAMLLSHITLVVQVCLP